MRPDPFVPSVDFVLETIMKRERHEEHKVHEGHEAC